MTRTIYRLQCSTEEDRPFGVLTREVQTTADREQSNVHSRILRGQPGGEINLWKPPDLVCEEPGSDAATNWDYYSVLGTSGIFSQAAIDVLREYLHRCFVPLPARFEGEPYYFLHIRERIDCLNSAESEIKYFDDGGVMEIKRYAFFKERIPDSLIFVIPELALLLFATEPIPAIVQEAGLKGFQFELVDGDPAL